MTAECREVRELADAYLSEQLLVETMHDIVRHLEGCLACRAEFDGRRRLRTGMKAAFERVPELQPRAEFQARLRARLEAEAAATAVQVPPWRHWGALAASLLLVAGLGIGTLTWLSGSSLAALARLAVGDHENCALTFRLAQKPISLEQAAEVYDAAFRSLQTVEPVTTALPGGPLEVVDRHSCVWNEVRFAHLVLRYKATIVSVIVASDAGATASWIPWARLDHEASALPAVGTEQVVSFRGARHTVFVVSSLPAADVQAVARVMTEPVKRALAGA
ncbi:MAG: hypothetical protein ABI880_00295 [Acidobacteriota bacterium]